MRKSAVISIALHLAILLWAVVAFPTGRALDAPKIEDVPIDIVEPMGFPWGDKSRKRSAMDYGEAAEVVRHADFDAFKAKVPGRLVLLTTKGDTLLPDAAFEADDTLLMGSESAGAPDFVHLC